MIDIFWLACRIAADNQYTHQLAESIIVGFALFASNLIIVFNAFRYEVFYRQQFLRTRMQYRNTRRLTHQLKVLSENHAIPSSGLQFETPLEQAMRMIRLLIADSNASSDQILKLDTVLQLLNSPQLLTSDVERQLSVAASSSNDERSLLDDDQKSYLISTISNSGRKALDVPKSSASSFMVRRKRRNSTATYMTSLMNIGENAIIPPVPSLPRALSSVDSSQDAESVQTQRRDVPDAIRALSLSSRKITAGAEPPEIQEETSVSKPNPFNFAMAQLFQLRFEPDVQLVPGFSKVSKIPRPSSMLKSSEDTNPVRAIELLDTIYDWNWPLFEFAECCPGEKPLYILAWHLFDDSGLFEAFDIPSDKFNNFMWRIQEGYRELPYHNATHAADVLHAVNYFSQLEGVKDIIERRPLDLLAIYIAAAIHDYDHPGLNNNYLINTKNPLAILYNDLSVLESYHVSSAFQILLKPECNFMVNFSKADWQYIRELVIEMVLATDLLQHTKAVAQFRTMVSVLGCLISELNSTIFRPKISTRAPKLEKNSLKSKKIVLHYTKCSSNVLMYPIPQRSFHFTCGAPTTLSKNGVTRVIQKNHWDYQFCHIWIGKTAMSCPRLNLDSSKESLDRSFRRCTVLRLLRRNCIRYQETVGDFAPCHFS